MLLTNKLYQNLKVVVEY